MLNGLISLLARIVVSIELDSAVGKRIVRQSASRKQITSDDGTTGVISIISTRVISFGVCTDAREFFLSFHVSV